MGIRSYEILEATSEDGAEGIGFTADRRRQFLSVNTEEK